jgi:hypothetical protein
MPEYGADAGHLAKYVDAKASAFLGNVGKIQVVAFVETFDLLLGGTPTARCTSEQP